MLPASFDPLLLQDHLLETLQRSPITQQFAVLRAEELLQAVIEKPIVNSLKADVERLQAELAEEKRVKRTMRSDSKQHTKLTAKECAQKEAHISSLREELEELSLKLEEASRSNQQLQQLCEEQEGELNVKNEENEALRVEGIRWQKEVEMLSQRKEELETELRGKDGELKIAVERLASMEKQYEGRMREMERNSIRKEEELQRQVKNKIEMQLKDKLDHDAQIKLKEKLIQSLKDERFKLKNEINSLKIDLTELKAEYESLKKQEEISGAELQQVREGLRQIKLGFDRERKMLNSRLHDLTRTSKAHFRLKSHLKELAKSLSSVKQDHMRLGRAVADMLRKMGQENEGAVRSLLDVVGEKVAREVEQLAAQLKAQADEVKQAKSEARAKEEALERLQKQLNGGSREVTELRNDVKQHKREEERLRRELKKTLQQNQAKLTMMERKYAELYNKVSY